PSDLDPPYVDTADLDTSVLAPEDATGESFDLSRLPKDRTEAEDHVEAESGSDGVPSRPGGAEPRHHASAQEAASYIEPYIHSEIEATETQSADVLTKTAANGAVAGAATAPARITDINFTVADLHEALEVVRQFDPQGIACRDLRECLLYQLRYHL